MALAHATTVMHGHCAKAVTTAPAAVRPSPHRAVAPVSAPCFSGRVDVEHFPGLKFAQHARSVRARVAASEPLARPSPNLSIEKHQNSKYQPARHEEVYSSEMSCPMGGVEAIMRKASQGILTTTPNVTLQSIIPLLNKVTGLPVLDENGTVVGVISRKDIIRVRNAAGVLSDKVAKHMTAPAITVPLRATVEEAADIMLQYGIRRLPVVDDAGRPLGVVSRSDIFKPLGDYTKVMEEEVALLLGKGSWQIKYLFDGSCPICSSMKELLERQDKGAGRIIFVDVSAGNYRPSKNMGISVDEAMTTIHAIRPDGSVLQGTDAIRAMYTVVGLGWLAFLMELPLFTNAVDVLYEFISRNRISLGSAMDTLLAGKKLQMSKQGVTTCSDVDEECSVDW